MGLRRQYQIIAILFLPFIARCQARLYVPLSQANVVALSISPTQQYCGLGGNRQFSAVATFTDGTMKDVSGEVTWKLPLSPSNVSISNSGRIDVSAGSTGITSVTASLGNTSASAKLVVVPGYGTVARFLGSPWGLLADNVAATTIPLNTPAAVATDAAGNFYVFDSESFVIRKITPGGLMTTVAGNGTSGYSGDGGPATSAQISQGNGIAITAGGTIYFSDRINHVIRKVSGGIISTYAGSGTAGYSGDGGPLLSAKFNQPKGLGVNASGDLFIADSSNMVVREITSAGVLSTFAGNNTYGYSGDGLAATAAAFKSTNGIAVDTGNNIFISDSNASVVRKVTIGTGKISTVAGTGTAGYSGDGANATTEQLNTPDGIALDSSNNLFIADQYNNRIRRVDAGTGFITTIAGQGFTGSGGDGGLATSASLGYPVGIAADTANNLFIADLLNHTVREITSATGNISLVAGGLSTMTAGDGGLATNATLSTPVNIAFKSNGDAVVSDQDGNNIRAVAADTGVVTKYAGAYYGSGSSAVIGDGGLATNATFQYLGGVAVDASDNVYVSDLYNSRIRKIDAKTGFITTYAGIGSCGYLGDNGQASAATICDPQELLIDHANNLYFSDFIYHVVRKINLATGIITTVAGTGSSGLTGDGGLASAAKLNQPRGLAVDALNNLYISDSQNHAIRKVDAQTLKISTVAGQLGASGYGGDGGLATNANLTQPLGVAVDASSNLFISDYGNRCVRKVDSKTGIITLYAGVPAVTGFTNSASTTNSQFQNLSTVAFDSLGNLYILDTLTHTVSKVWLIP